MRRILMSALLLAASILLQLTWVNGLRLPGGGVPDLVLVVVASLGLASGPVPGAVAGFGAGLCLDLAPPASGVLGEYALVFVLVGYACGRLHAALARSALLPIAIVAAACAAAELLVAALGLGLQSAQVSLASIRQLLPAAVSYDIAISPFVLYLVLLAGAWLAEAAGDRIAVSPGSRGRPPASGASREVPAGALAGAGSLASGAAGGVVLLGLGGWLAGPPHSRRARRAAARRTPRLRPGAGHPGDGWIGSSAAVRGGSARSRPGGAVPHGFSGSGHGGSALRGPGLPGAALTGESLRGQAFRGRAGDPGKAPGGARLRSGVAGSAAPGQRPPRTLPPAPVRLRLRGQGGPVEVSRLLSGSALARAGRRRPRWAGGFRPGGQPGGSALPRTAAARHPGGSAPARLRIGGGHGRDGLVGGGALSRPAGAAPRPAAPRFKVRPAPAPSRKASRPATPRFRARPLAGSRPLPGRRPRFGYRSPAVLRLPVLRLLAGRRGSRSQVWRINSRWHNGGLE